MYSGTLTCLARYPAHFSQKNNNKGNPQMFGKDSFHCEVIQVGNLMIFTLPVVLKAELMIFFLNATVTTNSLSFSRRLVSLATRSRQNGLALLQIVFIVRNHLTNFLQHNNNLTGCNEWPAMDAVLPLVPNCYWQRS